ncbi:unnamed protein product [Mytilus coruscus]|uniref:Uncharacterized protein n=1 Tax=Mytilus coruscus TaxID=42192 RepID=A0A6J8CSC3_MYTCO|nr:unnamed protein product [Mytilus coruscus]
MHVHVPELRDQILASFANCVLLPEPQEPAESSLNLNSTVSNIQEPAPLDFTTNLSITRTTASTIATASTVGITTSSNTKDSTASSKKSIATIQELPLDLSMKTTTKLNPKPVEIPRKPLTPIIDCTIPTDIWNVKPLSLETNNYEHLCLDPRNFPESEVPETVSSGWGAKEERCYLPDGTVLELKEVWTSDQPTPAPTEEIRNQCLDCSVKLPNYLQVTIAVSQLPVKVIDRPATKVYLV